MIKVRSLLAPLLVLGGGVVLFTTAYPARADFALKPNDRVVFYGDSITEQRLYTTFVETFAVTRFPKLPVTFVHSGWGGDRVSGGGGGPIDTRLQRDVLAYNPTVMTIMLGMNDAAYRAFDQGIFDTYANGYVSILDKVKAGAPNVRFTVIQPSAYDDVTRAPADYPGGYNGVLRRYSDFVKKTGDERKLTVADLNTPVVDMLKKANATDPALAQKIIADRVHPGPGGHLIMAEGLLEAWDAPAVVTDVTIDAKSKKVAKAENTSVSGLQVGKTVTWTQNDAALPFPLDTKDPAVALAIKSSDFIEKLNQEPLKVTGLAEARYVLNIDGEEVGEFGREELAQGVNLATLDTPMMDQARDVHRLTIKHNDQHWNRWRDIQMRLQGRSAAVDAALPPLLKALDAEEDATVAEQRATAQPKPHKFELAPTAPGGKGANLALRKTYVVSDPNVFNYGYGALTDGSFSAVDNHTFATGDKDTFPKTATIDLGEASKINQVLVGMPPHGSTKTVKVSISTDGQKFAEVGSFVFPYAAERRRTFRFPTATARYVRLTYPDHYPDEAGYNKNFSFTSEVEVYGPAG
ncbi:GDSL family lipase [bacterium]|nr:MAG: GDSL family lipase [bacterium]